MDRFDGLLYAVCIISIIITLETVCFGTFYVENGEEAIAVRRGNRILFNIAPGQHE